MIKKYPKKKKRDWFLIDVMKTHMNGDIIIGCEVGTGGGRAMSNVLPAVPNLQLIEVAWYPKADDERYRSSNYNSIKAKRDWQEAIAPYLDRIQILEMPSNKAIDYVKDKSLDWVFIDADHQYKSVKEDIELWYHKVRPGGLVCGHDYNPTLPRMKGLIQAVDEFFGDDFKVYEPDHVWYHWKKKEDD